MPVFASTIHPPRRPYPEPKLQHIAPGSDQILLETVEYHCWHRIIAVPAGFVYDKSSVPRAFWGLLSPADLSDLAPLLHDWLYREPAARVCWSRLTRRDLRRRDVDRIFAEIMAAQGVNPIRRRLAHLAVRWFGYFAFQRPTSTTKGN